MKRCLPENSCSSDVSAPAAHQKVSSLLLRGEVNDAHRSLSSLQSTAATFLRDALTAAPPSCIEGGPCPSTPNPDPGVLSAEPPIQQLNEEHYIELNVVLGVLEPVGPVRDERKSKDDILIPCPMNEKRFQAEQVQQAQRFVELFSALNTVGDSPEDCRKKKRSGEKAGRRTSHTSHHKVARPEDSTSLTGPQPMPHHSEREERPTSRSSSAEGTHSESSECVVMATADLMNSSTSSSSSLVRDSAPYEKKKKLIEEL